MRIGVACDAGDYPVVATGTTQTICRHEATQAQATIDGVHERRAALHFDRAQKSRDTAREDREHLTRVATGVIFLNTDPDPITARQAHRRSRWQENTLLLTFDAHEGEPGAVGRHHTLHGSGTGSAATTSRPPRRVAPGSRTMLH